MSKGPGAVQRAIVKAVEECGASPLMWIAEQAGYDSSKLAVRQSFTRAAANLCDRGVIEMWNARWPLRVQVVSSPGADVDSTSAEFAVARIRHYEIRNPDYGRSIRFEAAKASLQGYASEVEAAIAADTARRNRLRQAAWAARE